MRGRITAGIIAATAALLLAPIMAGWQLADANAQNPSNSQSEQSQTQQSSKSQGGSPGKSQGTTIIHIATSASSPADAKRILTGLSMARHSAQAGRKTIVYFNGAAVKLATTGLSLADEVQSVLNVDTQLSDLSKAGIQVYAAKADVPGNGSSSDKLRSGVQPLSATELFKKITPDTVVLSF